MKNLPEDRPVVSVVIPTLNSAGTLNRCIESLKKGLDCATEFLVIDGGSSDHSADVAVTLGARFVNESLKRSSARKRGSELAFGAYLLFVDADQFAESGLIDECLDICISLGKKCVVIPEVDVGAGLWANCRRLDRKIADTPGLQYPRFFEKMAYDLIGGHSTDLQDFMEDRDLANRARSAGLPSGSSHRVLQNDIERFNPVLAGAKGTKSARDARLFYSHVLNRPESPWTVLSPRLSRAIPAMRAERAGVLTVCAMPIYLTVVYGPRTVLATSGWIRSRFGG